MQEDSISRNGGATAADAEARTTGKQIPEVEIMDSNSTSCSLRAQEENASARICAVQIAQAALLALDNTPGGFAESKPGQGHKTESMSHISSHRAEQVQEIVRSRGFPQPVPQQTGPDLSPKNQHSASPSFNPQQSEYRSLGEPSQPLPTHSPSAVILSEPPDTMSTENGGKSDLSSDVRTLWDVFSRHARVLFECQGRDKIYNARVLMRTTSPSFFKWYAAEGTIATSVLVLELLNVNGQIIKTFRVYRGAPSYFRLVQQCIWDTFWLSFSNNESDSISIYVSVPNDNSSNATEAVPSTDGLDRHTESQPPTNQSNGTARYTPRHKSNIHTILN
jgi:hypothetical protein